MGEKKRTLLLEPVGGVAGDMLVAALCDAGAPFGRLEADLRAALPEGTAVRLERGTRGGFAGARFIVEAPPSPHHASLSGILRRIAAAPWPEGAKGRAAAVFQALGRAEAKVHGVPLERVHFHEVGAWDSIADVAGTALCLDYLGVGDIFVGEIPVGGGVAETSHGPVPVPAPATLELLKGFRLDYGGPRFERATPTGAAALAALARPRPEGFRLALEAVGVGLGSRDPDGVPNLLRCQIGLAAGAEESELGAEALEVSAANLDDCPGEWLGHALERLLAAGALDAWHTPVYMKKGRPGVTLSALHRAADRAAVARAFFDETTTLGVRRHAVERLEVPRRVEEFRSSLGPARVKVSEWRGAESASPEFESCRALALETGRPLRDVEALVRREFEARPRPPAT